MPVPPVEEDKKAPKVPSIQIDDSHSTGKKNFSRLVVKANENKELASAGELIQSPVDTSPKLTPLSTNGVQDENAFNKEKDASSLSASETKTKDDDDISSNGKATPNSLANSDSLTSIAVNSSKPSSAAIFKNSASASSLHSMELKSAQKNTRSRISPFKCFHSNEKKFISDKIGKFITGFLSESRNNLLSDDVETGRTNTDDRNLLTASARRIFRDWRDRAHKMAARHVIPEKISYLRTKTPLTNNVTHQPSSTHSLASILPNSSSSSTSGEKQQLPSDNVHIHSEEFNRDRLLLNPSKLLDVKPKLNTRKFSVSKLNTDKSRRLNSDLSPTKLSEMKPRLTQSTTYHFEAE